MSTMWTVEQILGFAQDYNSIKSARVMASAEKWLTLGSDQQIVWGQYAFRKDSSLQVIVDLAAMQFSCACTTRKYPCSHVLGLLLMLNQQPESFTETDLPDWVYDQLSDILLQSERSVASDFTIAPIHSTTIQQYRETVLPGLAELELWLKDLVRGGLALAHTKPESYWQQMADRMVDAHASEIGREIRRMAAIPDSTRDWSEHLLYSISRLYLLIQGSKNAHLLSAAEQADLYAAIGWTPRSLQSNDQIYLRDNWFVAGKHVARENKFLLQRTWLWGETSRQPALILDIAHGKTLQMDTSFAVGTVIDADLCFFTSAYPLRAAITTQYSTHQLQQFELGYHSIQSAIELYGQAITANPWLQSFPLPLTSVTAIKHDTGSYIQDADGYTLPLHSDFKHVWHLHALSTGQPLLLFGEWDGRYFRPLTVWANDRLLELRIFREIA